MAPSLPPLYTALVETITQSPQGQLTFAEFMQWVLYDHRYGYYSQGKVGIGVEGDFVTSPALGQDFGELLTQQFREMWSILGQPSPFTLLEMGAGTGMLAENILREAQRCDPAFFSAIAYGIIETSPALKQQQQQRLQAFDPAVQWLTWSEITDKSLVGCCFSNELVDAFAVHRVTLNNGQLREIYVTVEQDQLKEAIRPLSTPDLETYFQDLGLDLTTPPYPEGYQTEVNLEAKSWLETLAQKLRRGYLLTIDYGYSAEKYYHPQRHQGTLQCYYHQRYHVNPYVNLAQQDITSHVNFTALQNWGQSLGLAPLGFTQQGLFLMNLGIGDRLGELSNGTGNASQILQRRNQIHGLIDPMGLGKFGILLQGKGLTPSECEHELLGFRL